MNAETMTFVSQAILGAGLLVPEPVNQVLYILRPDPLGLGPALPQTSD